MSVNSSRSVNGGDHRAFEQIYVKYKERIYSLCIYMSGDRETAKDLTQQISKLSFVAEVAIHLVGRHFWLGGTLASSATSTRKYKGRFFLVSFGYIL